MPDSDPLLTAALEIYAASPADFVATRKRFASGVGDRAEGARLGRLPKPAAAAAVVNALVRADDGVVAALVAVGDKLRDAEEQGDASSLRALAGTRRKALAEAVTAAVSAAEAVGLPVSSSTRDAVEATLQAVIIDPVAARAVASGLLVAALAPGADAASSTALPLEGIVPEAPPPQKKRGGHARAESAARRKARAAADRAETEAAKAAEALDEAGEHLDAVVSDRDEVRRRLDEVRAQVAELEGQESRLADDVASAQRARREAIAAERKARAHARQLRRKAT